MAQRTRRRAVAVYTMTVLLLAMFHTLWLAVAMAGEPQHGLALGATVKYPAGFAHFDYADPGAVRGGTLTLSSLGGFDKLNPYSLKGRPPALLSTLLFESLTVTSLDEPFAVYGLLAETIQVADDGLSVTYRLNPRARFADGHPVSAEDVVFSYAILRSEQALPTYRAYYRDVTTVEALDRLTVRLGFARPNRELVLITGQLPILPRHFYGGKDFDKDFNAAALGSGPYTVKNFEFGKVIHYQRHPNYWGRGLNVNVGKYNVDEIVVKFYKDDTVRLEGLKAGEFDVLDVHNSKQWARDIGGEKWDRGYLVQATLPHHNTAGMQGFVYNVRRRLFQQRHVRHALALALDFAWMNATLFYKQYTANASFFDNSELAAQGLPAPAELALLEPWRAQLAPAVFSEPMQGLGTPADLRQRLRAAQQLLKDAGWAVKDGVLTETATGQAMRFTITLNQPEFQRITEPYIDNLRKLGVQATMKVVDDSVYERLRRTYDFDMLVEVFPQSQSPGNEQRDVWHSSAADEEGSGNIIGIKHPAVDALVEAIITATSRAELVTAVHALDRVLWHEHYVVPHWFIAYHRLTYWNKFAYPKTLPLYYEPFDHLAYWWVDPTREQALTEARTANRALPR